MLVEDDADDALLISGMIREAWPQAAIDHNPTAREALAGINGAYDVFIFDHRLGENAGLDLLKTFRTKNVDAPIIILTGRGDQEVAVSAMKAGATDYLRKSKMSTETLADSIRHSLTLHQESKRRRDTENKLHKSHQEIVQANRELKESVKKLKTAQNQLLRTEKLAGIGRLAAGVCHEILNPLNIISGHTQALLMEREDDEVLVEDLRSIMEEIQRIEKIIGGLLKFSRKGEVDLQEMNINKELDSVLSILERDMNLEGVHVERLFDPGLPAIPLDSDRMRQVFLNIINNAKYAMKSTRGGVLKVSTEVLAGKNGDPASSGEKAGSTLRIKFTDSGPGIKKEDLRKIFDPFFTTKPEDQGTGLGLSVCHTIIEKHGGTLEVESRENGGATFIIDLPCTREKEPVAG
jgi:signal transduction histidine kinase